VTALMAEESLSSPPGTDFVQLVIKEIVRETADATSFVFDIPEHLAEAFRYESGQFVTIRPEIDGQEVSRCYSMSSAPSVDSDLRITVKRVAGGRVSNWLADRLVIGDSISVSRPGGRFVLAQGAAPLVLFAGGSGITPVLSIIKTALHTTARPVAIFYANRDSDSVIFAAELERLKLQFGSRLTLFRHLDAEHGLADAADINTFCNTVTGGGNDVEYFICGPGAFMTLAETGLYARGADRKRIHVEKFQIETAAALSATAAKAAPVELTAEVDGRSVSGTVRPGQTLLTAARSAGMHAPFSCEIGTCGTCIARLIDGEVKLNNNDVLTDEELADGYILMCQAMPTTPIVRVVYD
jgi:3-ketosteroid 9alpha-monooxygenase subunit B